MKQEKPVALDIDLASLEEECQLQPGLMYEAGTQLADQRKNSKIAKNKLKLKAAELGNAMRERPDDFGLSKTTDKAVEDAVLAHKDYQELLKDLIEIEYGEDVCESFKDAVVDRKKELENLVQLHGQMYWSKADTRLKTTEQSREKIMQRVNKKSGKK